jgi:hypothetical protein
LDIVLAEFEIPNRFGAKFLHVHTSPIAGIVHNSEEHAPLHGNANTFELHIHILPPHPNQLISTSTQIHNLCLNTGSRRHL